MLIDPDGFFPKSAENFEVLCRLLGQGSLEIGKGVGNRGYAMSPTDV